MAPAAPAPIRFRFAPAKALAALHWMLHTAGSGGADLHRLLKAACFADKAHLNKHGRPLVAAEVVHHHDVTRPQLRHQRLLHPSLENHTVDRAVDHKGGDDAAAAHAGDQRGGLPMAMRHRHAQALATRAAAVAARHVGAGPTLVHEHQAVGVEVELPFEPSLASDQDVGALLFGRVRGLFLRV